MHSKQRRGGWEQYRTGGDWWRRLVAADPKRKTVQISSEGKNP
jgi:hypothetical protein